MWRTELGVNPAPEALFSRATLLSRIVMSVPCNLNWSLEFADESQDPRPYLNEDISRFATYHENDKGLLVRGHTGQVVLDRLLSTLATFCNLRSTRRDKCYSNCHLITGESAGTARVV
jgi:hypothetical protein